MKTKLKLFIFPVFCVFCLLIAWLTSRDFLPELLHGERTDGRIVSMVRTYNEQQQDVIARVVQMVVLEQADGGRIEADIDNNAFESIRIISADDTQITNTTEEIRALIEQASDGLADNTGRFLQREGKKEAADRIVRVVRREHAIMLQGVSAPIENFTLRGERLFSVVSGNADRSVLEADDIITTIEFTYIGGTEKAKELKIDVRRSVTRTLNDNPVEADNEDFIFYEKDFRYAFRPIFIFDTPGGKAVAISDTGARKSPKGVHKLGTEVKVAYLPGKERDVILLSNFDEMKNLNAFDKLNFLFVASFGRYFFPLVFLLVGIVYALLSVTLFSLAIKPPHTENADTVDTDSPDAAIPD